MKISLIASVSQNNVIGDGKTLLWYIPGDLPRFKQITTGHNILMGRRTFDSIGRVLPGRTNLIVSNDKNLKVPGALVFDSPEAAAKFAEKNDEDELMVIGGGTMYKYFLPKADTIYLTRVFKDYKGTAMFPELNLKNWKEEVIEKNLENDPPFETVKLSHTI